MLIAILFILFVTFGIGLPFILLISRRFNLFMTLGLSFPLGIGIFTQAMFIANLIGVRFSLLNESLILLMFSAPLVFFGRAQIREFFMSLVRTFKQSNLSIVEKVMLGALVFLVVTSFINTFYWPVHIWDSVVLYDFRGHVFAMTGFMKDAFINGYYFGYPLLTSLAHTIVYLAGGKYPQFLYSLFYLSLGVSFYGLLREFVSRKLGILFTLILLIAQPLFYHSLISLTNLPYTVYLSLGAICVYLWDTKRDTGYLILSALLVGLSTWTRSSEPFWLAVLLIVFLVSIYRKKIWNILTYSLFFFPIYEAWKVFQNSLIGNGGSTVGEVAGYTRVLPTLFNIEKWGQILVYLYKYVVVPWGPIFTAFVLAVISAFLLKKQKKLFLIFFIIFVFLGVLIIGTFGISLTVDFWYRIGDAAERLSMLFYPLFIFYIVLVIQEFVKIQK